MIPTIDRKAYASLLAEFQPKVIATEAENEEALLVVEKLMHCADRTPEQDALLDLLVILIATLAFVAVAIACWTTLPQIAAIEEAREKAENLFYNAIDATLILDNQGKITQNNLAAERLFEIKSHDLVGYRLNKLVTLPGTPEEWPVRSQLKLIRKGLRLLESTVAQRTNQGLQEYIITLRDISDRGQVIS